MWRRDKFCVATKYGVLRDEYDQAKRGVDNSYEYTKQACDASIRRLDEGVGIDLFYMHRIANQGAQLDEAMRAMAELLQEGKIKAVGLSEASREQLEVANAALKKYTNGKHQLAALQTEYSLLSRVVETNGVLKYCQENQITFVAYSPISRGLLGGDISGLSEGDCRNSLPRFQQENKKHNEKIVAQVQQLAERNKCSVAQLALAWLMHKGVVPIPGTTKLEHLHSNLAANSIKLDDSTVEALDDLPQPLGDRYTEASMRVFGLEDEME